MNQLSTVVGTLLVDGFHSLALFAIGGASYGPRCTRSSGWRAGGSPASTTSCCCSSTSSSARWSASTFRPITAGAFLIYVAMTALTRMMIADIQAHQRPDWEIPDHLGAPSCLSRSPPW